jgi:hypothetical protein
MNVIMVVSFDVSKKLQNNGFIFQFAQVSALVPF